MDRPRGQQPRYWTIPTHEPKERTSERVDDGFVLIGGWQLKYRPTPKRRKRILSVAYRVELAEAAQRRRRARRAAAEH